APAEPWRRKLGRSLALPMKLRAIPKVKRDGLISANGAACCSDVREPMVGEQPPNHEPNCGFKNPHRTACAVPLEAELVPEPLCWR
ncbi:MAG: hypothetical protein ACOVLE_11965, partial [Pirellula staleyi]